MQPGMGFFQVSSGFQSMLVCGVCVHHWTQFKCSDIIPLNPSLNKHTAKLVKWQVVFNILSKLHYTKFFSLKKPNFIENQWGKLGSQQAIKCRGWSVSCVNHDSTLLAQSELEINTRNTPSMMRISFMWRSTFPKLSADAHLELFLNQVSLHV